MAPFINLRISDRRLTAMAREDLLYKLRVALRDAKLALERTEKP